MYQFLSFLLLPTRRAGMRGDLRALQPRGGQSQYHQMISQLQKVTAVNDSVLIVDLPARVCWSEGFMECSSSAVTITQDWERRRKHAFPAFRGSDVSYICNRTPKGMYWKWGCGKKWLGISERSFGRPTERRWIGIWRSRSRNITRQFQSFLSGWRKTSTKNWKNFKFPMPTNDFFLPPRWWSDRWKRSNEELCGQWSFQMRNPCCDWSVQS